MKVDAGGTLVLTNPGNTYSGGTTVTGGILNFNADATLGDTTASPNITFNGSAAGGGGTLQFASAYSGTSLSSSRNISVTAGGSGTIDTNGNNITWGGTLNVAASRHVCQSWAAGSCSRSTPPPTLGSNSCFVAVSGGTLRLELQRPLRPSASALLRRSPGAATLELLPARPRN